VFSLSTLEDIVRIPPDLFGTSLNKAAINILKSKYESMVKPDLGYIIMILNADVEPMGKVIAGDGGTFHRVTFDALTFYPKLQEIIYGELVDITDFGAFARIGPTDALLHLSQVMDDYLKSNIASGVILANQSGRTLKIGITCRQPFLGTDEWIEEDLKKSSGTEEKVEAKKEKKEEKVEAKKEKKEEKVEVKEK